MTRRVLSVTDAVSRNSSPPSEQTSGQTDPDSWPIITLEELRIQNQQSSAQRTSLEESNPREREIGSTQTGQKSDSQPLIPATATQGSSPFLSDIEVDEAELNRRRFLITQYIVFGVSMGSAHPDVSSGRVSAFSPEVEEEKISMGIPYEGRGSTTREATLPEVGFSLIKKPVTEEAAIIKEQRQIEGWQELEEEARAEGAFEIKRICERCEMRYTERLIEWNFTKHDWGTSGPCAICGKVLSAGISCALHWKNGQPQ